VFKVGTVTTNLTLSLDDDLLQEVREYLKRYVDAKSLRLQALHALDALAERMVSAKRGQSPFYTFE
jgi:hypothetical protein